MPSLVIHNIENDKNVLDKHYNIPNARLTATIVNWQ